MSGSGKNIKNKHLLRFRNGEQLYLVELNDGTFACPICGARWHEYPPYYPNDGSIGEKAPFAQAVFADVCPGCELEYGYEVGDVSADAQAGAVDRMWTEQRMKWLDKVAWGSEYVSQLRDNLGIDEEHLREQRRLFPQSDRLLP